MNASIDTPSVFCYISPSHSRDLWSTFMNLIGEQIYDALLRDPSFASQIQTNEGRAVWRDLCETLPETLHEFLSQPVGTTSVFGAKLAVLKLISQDDWIKRIVESQPPNALFDLLAMTGMFQDMLNQLIAAIPEIVGDIPTFLSSQGIDEETFLGHPKGGRFTEATMTRWKQGDFTIAELLTTQPGVILQND